MAKNPYWNTMWSNRDQEFYWSGVKGGVLVSAIMMGLPLVSLTVYYIINEYENKNHK